MKRIRVVTLVVAVLVFTFALGAGVANAETVEAVSLNQGDGYTDANSQNSDISADGRYVAFGSAADLVPEDGNGCGDIYVRDRVFETSELASVNDAGEPGNAVSSQPSISDDGCYVAFQSAATNLVEGDSNGFIDVFVRDLVKGITTLMSVDDEGNQGTGNSTAPSVTADDERVYVAYESTAPNLIGPGVDTNGGTKDVFVSYYFKNDPTRVYTELVSQRTNGTQGINPSRDPSISGNGQYVAYESDAWLDDDSPNDTDSYTDIYVTDWDKDGTIGHVVTELVSVRAGGGGGTSYDCLNPSISADGKYVAYDSRATSLVLPADTGTYEDVFVTDWNHADPNDIVTVKASPDRNGGEGNARSEYPSLSADGRYVAFESGASDLVPDDGNGFRDIFVRDLWTPTPTIYLVSTDFFGNPANANSGEHGNSLGPQITASSGDEVPLVSFFSRADNLDITHISDPFDQRDVFVATIDTTPTITYVTPASGSVAGGELVYIYGTNFIGLDWDMVPDGPPFQAVTFGGVYAPNYVQLSTMKIIATSPAHAAGTVQVQVLTVMGPTADTPADDYTYLADYVPPVEKPKGGPNRYEEDNELILYSGDWSKGENDSLSKKAGTSSEDQQATITITFKGTKLDWIATLGPNMGKALVSIDGGEAVLVDLYSATELYQQLVWSTGDLAYGVHTMTITFPEGADYQEGKGINLDALDVTGVLLKTEEVAKP